MKRIIPIAAFVFALAAVAALIGAIVVDAVGPGDYHSGHLEFGDEP